MTAADIGKALGTGIFIVVAIGLITIAILIALAVYWQD